MTKIAKHSRLGCKKKNKMLELLCNYFDEQYRGRLKEDRLEIIFRGYDEDMSISVLPIYTVHNKYIHTGTKKITKRIKDFKYTIISGPMMNMTRKEHLSITDAQEELIRILDEYTNDNSILQIYLGGYRDKLIGAFKIVDDEWINID